MTLAGIVEFLISTHVLGQSAFVWLCFMSIILVLLVLDLGLMNRRDEIISPRKSLVFSGFYVALSVIFGAWLWSDMGPNHGLDYFTAYLIEMSLSLDNLFVMSVVLSYFAVPRHYQHRVLFWGIIGVLVMRGMMIGFGAALINAFSWVLFIFAGFLILTGIKMLLMKEDEAGLENSALIRFFQKHMRFTKEIRGHSFFIRRQHPMTNRMVTYATPLFMALLCIEFLDVLFALDSVPAVFAITKEPFVVYTSNIFAILGLRSMYFAMAAVLERFKYMKYALSIILIFIGVKVFYNHMDPSLQFFGAIKPFYSLAITIVLLLAGVVFSLIKTRSDQLREEES
jgi:tellurite resistance protein TerC